LGDASWRRVLGLRVVMSWPDDALASPPGPPPRGTGRVRFFGFVGVLLVLGGAVTMGVATLSQRQAPQPSASAAGATGAHRGPSLRRSIPVAVSIPAINVHSKLLRLGLNSDGSIQVPPLPSSASLAAWYKYSATPGQIGASVIEGHVDSYSGPAVFFRLGALRPGDTIDVTLADGVTAIFRVTGVREYPKIKFPGKTIYGATDYAALRLITCGGTFDNATGHYLGSTVVFASLSGYRAPGSSEAAAGA
jgi:sortase family protein